VRLSFKPMTRVGVFSFASCLSLRWVIATTIAVQRCQIEAGGRRGGNSQRAF
jgi:hypothetical protein